MQNQAPQAPATPVIPKVVVSPGTSAPNAVYKAFSAQRRELGNQLDQLENKRNSLSRELQLNRLPAGVSRQGTEARISELDKRISGVEKQISDADANVANAAAVPGAVLPDRPPQQRSGPPEEGFVLGGMFIVAVLFPLSIAMARRIWRRGAAAVTAFPQEFTDRFNRLDQAVDSIAIEVERIGEGQRFVTRVMSDNGRALGAGAAAPMELPAREKARERGSM
ncbi:MAG: hypothetical protein JWM95_5447 [Gemmatimonadetes bacterium]|nr:hypothetical protein [Gemmatimonadota bacterium]